MYYNLIKMQYRNRAITAAQVWAYADEGKITEKQAISICGARPNE